MRVVKSTLKIIRTVTAGEYKLMFKYIYDTLLNTK